MDRQLVVWCPELLVEEEDGRRSRAFAQVMALSGAYCPAVAAIGPGVCALAARGPARYFGGEDRLARRLQDDLAGEGQVGVADGLFAALLAARTAVGGPVVVPPGETPAFLAPWPVEVLDRPELADLLHRLGLPTLGAFASLPTRHGLGRLGAEAVRCQEVARGISGELPGLRLAPRVRPPAAPAAGPGGPARQAGFWGEASAAADRAELAVRHLEPLVGPEGAVVGRLQGGRGPSERARLVPWSGRHLDPVRPGAEPWPGQLPPPAPAVVPARPLPAVLVDRVGGEVGCSAAGLPTAAPARLSVAGGPWQEVTAWAGPWPADERWWAGPQRRRRARMQLVTAVGLAYLVVREGTAWWVEGAYD